MPEDTPWHEPGRWHSPRVYWEELHDQIPTDDREIKIIDSTLTEGEDMVGRHMGWNEWINLTKKLDQMGVAEIQNPIGQPMEVLFDYVDAVRDEGVEADLQYKGILFRHPLEENYKWRKRAETRLDLPFDSFLSGLTWNRLDSWEDFNRDGGADKEDLLRDFEVAVDYITDVASEKPHDPKIVAPVGTFEVKLETTLDLCQTVADAGGDGIYIFDSKGHNHSMVSRVTCEKIKENHPDLEIYVQHHNDLGLSTAASLGAAEGGADYLDCTVAGVGDRAGTAAVEEVACALDAYGWDHGIELSELNDTANYLIKAMDLDISPHRPVIGWQMNKEEGLGHRSSEDDPPEVPMGISGEVLGRPYETFIGSNQLTKEQEMIPDAGLMGSYTQSLIENWGYENTEKNWKKVEDRLEDQLIARGYITKDEFKKLVDGVLG